ncbi:A-agglutinin anchorage subunit-like [Sander lucioperca]|uniref:A-agglutinin anchorage subunit-like n=1 Tax=Sander lucioperca TaxID=283035 RepID=UPI001653C685|nr:A-agglutinin anchorage subunit-like [Sander lucioperca]
MKMKMKSKLLYAAMAMVVMSALVGLTSTTTPKGTTTTPKPTTTTPKPTTTTTPRWTSTTGASGLNLNGKMFTLSRNGEGISFYSPYYSPTTPTYSTYSNRPYYTTNRPYYTTNRPYYTTTRPYTTTTTRPWTTTTPRPRTTAPPTRGVSVCLRYLPDYLADIPTIFTLSPSGRSPLQMGVSSSGLYGLSFDRYGYNYLYLKPYKRFSQNIVTEIWTRVCLTVDTMKNVAQLFSDSSMSIRKMLPTKYVWSGEPVIDFSGFDGQVTDVQIWDYPLYYREVFQYMTGSRYGPYSGSALSWSYISYSPRGNVLLEDVYEPQWQDRQPINRSKERKGRWPKGEKKTREFFNLSEEKREQF